MNAIIRKEGDNRVTLILDGRLDASVASHIAKEVEPLFDYSDCEIVIDCSQLDYISSSGLRLLMIINQRCRANHCELYIMGLQERVQDVFQTTGFVNLFQFK